MPSRTSSAVGRERVPSLDFRRWMVMPLSSVSGAFEDGELEEDGTVRRIGA